MLDIYHLIVLIHATRGWRIDKRLQVIKDAMVRDEEPSSDVKHCQRVGCAIIPSF